MKRPTSFFLITLFFVIGAVHSCSKGNWAEDQRTKAIGLLEEEKAWEAISLLETAAETAKRKYGEYHRTFADISTELAILCFLAGDREQAELGLQRALRIYKNSTEQDPVLIGNTHVKLAELYESQGDMESRAFHTSRAIESFRQVVDPNDPALLELERDLRAVPETDRSEDEGGGEIRDWDEYFFGKTPAKEQAPRDHRATLRIERLPDRYLRYKAEYKTAAGEPVKDSIRNNTFEILAVEFPETLRFDQEGLGLKFPTLTVTYRLHTTKDQARWIERFDVVCPDGTLLYAGGGTRWYFDVPRQGAPTYTVDGTCTEEGRGTYRFRLVLEGEGLTPRTIERSFELE